MHIGLWIALGTLVFLLILYIIFDKRKKIFKKKVKTEKTVKEQEKKEITEKKEKKISFDKKSKNEKPQQAMLVEKIEEEKDSAQYQMQSEQSTRSIPRFNRQSNLERRRYYKQKSKKSIKQQIKDLSPEMKAILFANLLERKDDI